MFEGCCLSVGIMCHSPSDALIMNWAIIKIFVQVSSSHENS